MTAPDSNIFFQDKYGDLTLLMVVTVMNFHLFFLLFCSLGSVTPDGKACKSLLKAYLGVISLDGMECFHLIIMLICFFETDMLSFPFVVGDPSLFLL